MALSCEDILWYASGRASEFTVVAPGLLLSTKIVFLGK